MSQTTFTDGLGYEGKVTLTLKSNDRVLSTKTYKNNGNKSLKYFLETLEEEKEKQKTLIGPHLDDFRVLLNNMDIATFGSQGQNRLAILSIKLGLLKFISSLFV